MTFIQRVATVFGAIFVLVGLAGFTPIGMGAMQMDGSGAEMLLGVFPVNAMHNVVHMLFGVWGLWAGRSVARSIAYALGSGGAYLLLGVLGMFMNSLLGIVPIGGYDVYLHLVLALALAGGGFWAMWFTPQRAPVRA